MIIGNKEFGNHTYVMGMLNVTPDSFSDEVSLLILTVL